MQVQQGLGIGGFFWAIATTGTPYQNPYSASATNQADITTYRIAQTGTTDYWEMKVRRR